MDQYGTKGSCATCCHCTLLCLMQHGKPDAMHVHAAACPGAAAANSSAAPMTVGQAGITHTDTQPSLQLQHLSCTQCSYQQRQNRPAADKEGQQAHPISSCPLHTRLHVWLQVAQLNLCFHEHAMPARHNLSAGCKHCNAHNCRMLHQ